MTDGVAMTIARATTSVALVLGTACGGAAVPAPRTTTPGQPIATFPDKVSFPQPDPKPIDVPRQLSTVEVTTWRIESAVPAPGASYPLQTYWDRLLMEALGHTTATEQAGRLNPALRCAATETARFYVETEGYPSEALRSYVLLRCGTTFTSVDTSVWQATVPDAMPEGRVEVELTQGVRDLLSQATASKDRELGVGYARGKGRAAIVIYSGKRSARLIDFSPLFQGVGVTVNVEITGPVATVTAFANQGRFGVKVCDADPGATAPTFRFFCPIATDNVAARVNVAVRRAKAVLYEPVAHALYRRNEDAGLSYELQTFGADALAADGTAFREALYGALNDARKAAGAPELRIEARQAAWNDRVTPSFYRAMLGKDQKLGEQAALAMLAGWDVEGTIRDGGFFAAMIPNGTQTCALAVGGARKPIGRWVLLDRSPTRVAISTAELTTPGIAALVTTYSLFDGVDHRADETKLMALITAKRAALGRGRPKFRPASGELRSALARVEQEGISAYAALTDLVHDLGALGEPVERFRSRDDRSS